MCLRLKRGSFEPLAFSRSERNLSFTLVLHIFHLAFCTNKPLKIFPFLYTLPIAIYFQKWYNNNVERARGYKPVESNKSTLLKSKKFLKNFSKTP